MRLNKTLIAIFVNLLLPLGGMSTDVYLPSMPAMTQYFHAPIFEIQLTLTFFALGLGLAQLIAGPISDSIGRKKPLLVGLVLQLVMVIIILLTHSTSVLIAARFMQGLGAGFMMVPGRAILSDIYDGASLKKQLTYITASFALGPIVAPFIGGYLQHYFGWHANFLFILIYIALMLLGLLLIIPETIAQKKPYSLKNIKHSYISVMTHHYFAVSVVLVSFMMGFVSMYNVVGPFFIQTILGKSAVYYGYVALFMGCAWFGGNITSRVFSGHHWKRKTLPILCLMVINGLAMLWISTLSINIYSFVLPIFMMIYLAGFLFPIYVSETLSLFRAHAASANGLLFSLVWVIFSAFSFVGALLKVHSSMPFAIAYFSAAAFCFIWFLIMFQRYSVEDSRHG